MCVYVYVCLYVCKYVCARVIATLMLLYSITMPQGLRERSSKLQDYPTRSLVFASASESTLWQIIEFMARASYRSVYIHAHALEDFVDICRVF
uniref:Uncharacterized protein n=1 Tax=Trichogramma kaykai TaxID=54128 RepID=A0ABD2X1D6_9HYME